MTEQLRTVALKVPSPVHAQLTLLAQLQGRPLVEEIREAIDEHIARRGADVDLSAQAQTALDAIDAEAAQRRAAIESLLKRSPSKGRRKGGGEG
ncbi:MAG: hypothetical protein ACYDCC_09625 [Actinomycetota bacterium]